METIYKTSISEQFGAAIDMFDATLRACPDELWQVRLWENPGDPPAFAEFWYIAYHTLFWLDLYLSGAVEGFVPPAPYTLDELDAEGLPPEQPYTKVELQCYLEHCRQKCRSVIAALTPDRAQQICKFPWGEITFAALLLYNMRHVQEHAAQLSLILGQQRNLAAGWVTRAQRN